ncbi:hypothetical protein [uncultured Tateyamaria sp.]|uniref:hypothetical protein n=1 Tax=uncultured Tateyamaria sp. TaxID=455651 RepID=UPI00260501F8|nr:hypothetical protein [uncultured Tateyamaria sp.]
MKRISILLSSLSVVAVVGACGPANEITTRAAQDPLSFRQGPSMSVVEVQADALNHMADQLVLDSKVRGSFNSALVDCGLAILTPGKRPVCGRNSGSVELVPAVALVDNIQDMHGQMDTLEVGLPDMIAAQDARLADLEARRIAGAVSEAQYDEEVAAINRTRTRIAESLALTAAQAERAQSNMQTASARGQVGLGWHLNATAQLARDVNGARAQLGLLDAPVPVSGDYVASNVPVFAAASPITHRPRSGELR